MAATSRPIVGILGGMGPEATVLLMSRIIALTPAEDDADHVPLLVDHNPQVPSRIKALVEGGGEDPGPVLANMARRLAGAGATALAMPCNTAHAHVPVITAAVDLPFINMIERTAAHLAGMDLSNRRVGILASTAVQKLGLYDHALDDHGLAAVFPRSQADLLVAIRQLKRDARHPQARETQMRVAEELLADNVDVLLIACTEFSLIADAMPAGARVVDALDVLAAAISAFSSQD
jgi:aspartate racemase